MIDYSPDLSEKIEELRKTYVQTLPHKLSALTEALTNRDLNAVTRIGHQLKGSGSSFGFSEVSALGAQIEEAAQYGQYHRIQALITEFESLAQRISAGHSPSESS